MEKTKAQKEEQCLAEEREMEREGIPQFIKDMAEVEFGDESYGMWYAQNSD